MIFERQYQATVYNERATSQQAGGLTVATDLGETKVVQGIFATVSTGKVSIAHGATVTLPLPSAYVVGDRIMMQVRIEDGVGRITMTSTDFAGSSIILVKSTTTQAGMWAGVVKPTVFTIDNPHATATIKAQWSCIILPDITLEASFRGMQSTGAETTIV